MKNDNEMKIIAHIHSDFPSKFGIPRQSGLVDNLYSTVVFEPEYRNPDALRGLEGYSHIWLIWKFSQSARNEWSPTVRPPRLGGNTHMGVFASRSPFRPNPIGLSSVKLEKIISDTQQGTVLCVSGADLMDGTPIYDIKPYLAYVDSHPQATGGFALESREDVLKVIFPDEYASIIPQRLIAGLRSVLAQDPRPAYQNDPNRIYGMPFSDFDIKFKVDGDTLTVCGVER